MNKIIIFLLISFSTQAQIISHIGAVTYDRKIRKAEPIYLKQGIGFTIRFDGIETPSTTDLRAVLELYTQGQTIAISKVPLAARTGQTFYISANSTSVVLNYTTPQSLDNAVYTYLNMLGITWYGAGVNWLVKPTVLNVPSITGQWIEPTFRQRNFNGTGGLDYGLSTDPTFEYKKNWLAFKRRNRFNGDFAQPSHSGQAFYIANVALSDAHPEWFYSDAGKYNGRIRVEIPAAVQAYKDWFIRTTNLNDSFININADPEDGRGNGPEDPLPPNGFQGLNNWNASEKWSYFANEIAKGYDSNNNKIHISFLSYGDGPTVTLVPRFPIKKNVYPVVTPYAFQTAYLPKQMIRVWSKAVAGNMGIYDYWNITQYSLGLPQFNIYSIPTSLKFWRQNKIDGIQQETTDAGGPMGHTFWLTGQMEFDTTKNFDTLYNKYLIDCFGTGRRPMKNMFDRWSLNYQYNQEVNFTLRDLKLATDSVVNGSPEWKRINDLKAYSHFMKLMAQRTNVQSNNDSIYYYMYSIHQRMMVQTSAFIGQHYLTTLAPTPLTDHQLTEAEIENNFNADIAGLPVEYGISNMVFNYDNATYIDSIPINAWSRGFFAGGQFKAKFTGTVSIDMGTQDQLNAKIFTEDSVFINEHLSTTNFTFTETLYGQTWSMKNYVINVVAGQTYNIGTSASGLGRIRVRTPGIIVFVPNNANDFDNSGYPMKYFYVPVGTTKIAYVDAESQPFNGRGYLIPPGGVGLIRTATSAANIYTVNVPAGMDGRVWKADMGHTGVTFNNIPNISTLQNFSYTEFP